MDLNARELLDAELCSPQCLLARDYFGGACQCRCGGQYHGGLSAAYVTEQRDRPLRKPSVKDGCPAWCDQTHAEPRAWSPLYDHHVEHFHQGPGHTRADHRGVVARMSLRGDTDAEVIAHQTRCIEHGWWTTPEVEFRWTEQDEGWGAGWMQIDICRAQAVADVLTVTGAGDSWLANALSRAAEIFGPADVDGNLWNERDTLLRMRDAWERDQSSAEPEPA